jgi:hypothetical protein
MSSLLMIVLCIFNEDILLDIKCTPNREEIHVMSVWIIYGLVIIFLLAFPLLVLAFVRSPEASVQASSNDTNTARSNGIAYGLLLAFFVLFALLTFVLQRGKGSPR